MATSTLNKTQQMDHSDLALVAAEVATDALVIGSTTVSATGSEINATTGASLSGSTSMAADVLAVPITHSIVLKTSGADAEALTLADGTPGQILTIAMVADGGGDATLTPTTKSGFTTIVFADDGDNATLRFIDSTVGWVLMGTAGVAAPPAITAA